MTTPTPEKDDSKGSGETVAMPTREQVAETLRRWDIDVVAPSTGREKALAAQLSALYAHEPRGEHVGYGVVWDGKVWSTHSKPEVMNTRYSPSGSRIAELRAFPIAPSEGAESDE